MTISITNHALAHWTGRCRQRDPKALHAAVLNGRMASKREARAISLYVARAGYRTSDRGKRVSQDQCIVCDETGCGFVLGFDSGPTVVSAMCMADVMAWVRELPHKPKPRLAKGR